MSKTVIPYSQEQGTKKEQVADMFNNISKTYDFLNHFMSLGIDIIWRKKAINELKKDQPKLILDVATGTGDFAFEALSILNPDKIVGVDISQGMLDIAKQKIAKRNLANKFEVKLGDSEKLPFEAAFPIKQLYNFYFNYITPGIGKLFSKDSRAYSYLPESVAAFPDGKNFIAVMDKVGFKHTKCRPLAFGICSIYTGIK